MSIEQFIDNEVKGNDVVLFMKGTPQAPMCGFSAQVIQILDHIGVTYKGLNVLESDELRNGIKSYSNWPTIPQLYVKGEFVGGCDIVREMFYTSQPMEMVGNLTMLEETFKMIAAETQLLYSSDYPHWDMDLPSVIYDLPFLSPQAKRNILGESARKLFKLDTLISEEKKARLKARAAA